MKQRTSGQRIVLNMASVMALASLALPLGVTSSEAARRGRGGEQVTGCSRFGHGCISGEVRPAKFGSEVRMPGGTWIGCAGDCRRKLSDETLDFWDLRRTEGAERPR